MRRSVLAVVTTAVALAAVGGATGTARADTPVTFTVVTGLSISQPSGTASLGAATMSLTGTSVSGSLGATTVTDTRGLLAGNWTTTIAGPSAGFQDSATPTPDTVPASAASVWVDLTTATIAPLASAVPTTLHLAQATGLSLTSAAQTLVTATTAGSNSVTFNPTIAVTIPASTPAGTYSGLITQTVS